MIHKIAFSERQLPEIADNILQGFSSARIFLLEAPMGAGKTTLIKQLCKTLGSSDSFSSPTFSIVNEYVSTKGKIYHFDLYRVKSETELFDLGIEEYLDSGHYCFIEWPKSALGFIEYPYVKISIEVQDNIRYLSAILINP